MLLIHAGLSAVCIGASVWGVRRVQRKQASTGNRRRWRLQLWRPKPGNWAMLWKEMFAERTASRLGLLGRIARAVIVLCVVGLALWSLGLSFARSSTAYSYAVESFVATILTLATLTASLGLLLYAARAATLVGSERERDCWTTLISTGLGPGEIVAAKVLGNIYAARGLWLLLTFLYGLAAVRHPPFALGLPFIVTAVAAVAWFATCLGVWFSLWCRTSMRAMGATVAVVTFVGGGYWFCCWPVMLAGPMMSDASAILFFAPTVPFLFAAPGILVMDAMDEASREFWTACAAYLLGTLGYAVAGSAILGATIANFDRLAGRISRRAPAIRTGASAAPPWVEPASSMP